MKELPREVEERYGIVLGVVLPVTVSPTQLQMLRAAETESEKNWSIVLLIFSGANVMAHGETDSGRLRLPEFRIPSDLLDLDEFEATLKEKVFLEYGLKIDLSRYLMLGHCTFMSDSPVEGDESDTSSRTLHLFTARALNSDDLVAKEQPIGVARLVKPNLLADSLQREWADVRAQLNTGGTSQNMRDDYNASWAFVRSRLVALAFQKLFGWELPEV
ncbi:MAG: hypothetical protein WCS37_09470 [Chloroflexota bacterium]|nr:hypothetical protein [Chloroflexota bacterium]